MNVTQLIKQVLDDAYGLIEEAAGPRDSLIKRELTRLSAQYKDLRKYANIDYSDPVTRFAYVFKYVMSHANLVYSLVSECKALFEVVSRDTVSLVCVGGGPGSDLLGVIKYLERTDAEGKLSAEIFDREPTWGETWSGLLDRVDTGVRVQPAFQTFDVTDRRTWSRFHRYLKADLFTMIYFVSEVYGIRDAAKPYFDHLLSNAKPGALLLYVDNDVADFTNWVDTLLTEHGWEVVKKGSERRTPPVTEERRDLGIYYEKFGDPKIQAYVAWRIVRKT